jgi:gliding motility-associated-like protein
MFKAKLAYISALLVFVFHGNAQKFNWSKHVSGNTGNHQVTAIQTNTADSAILAAVYFSDSLTVNSTQYVAQGGKDVLLVSLNKSGNINWIDHLRSSGTTESVEDMVHATSGGNDLYYFTGRFHGTTQSTVSTNSQSYGAGSFAIGVSTVIPSGGSTQLGPPNGATQNQTPSIGKGITRDASGNLFVLGEFRDSIKLNNTTLRDSGNGDVFFTRITASNLTPNTSSRIYSANRVEAVAIGYDRINNQIVVCGNFSSQVYFNASTSLAPDVVGSSDVFIARYSTAGALVSTSVNKIVHANSDVFASDMEIDAQGNAIITGRFRTSFTAGSTTRSSNGAEDIFVVKVAPNNTVRYAHNFGGNGNDRGTQITQQTNTVTIVSGTYRSSVINFGGGNSITTNSTQDGLIFGLDTAGGLLGARGGIMQLSTDVITSNALASTNNNVYIGGGFVGRAKFGTTGSYQSTSVFQPDGYLAQIFPTSIYCSFNDTVDVKSGFNANSSRNNLRLCTGDTGLLKSRAGSGYTFQWYRNGTAITGATSDSLEINGVGEYYLQLSLSAKGCSENTDSFRVALDTLPAVSILPDSTCVNNSPYPLSITPPFVNNSSDRLYGNGVNVPTFNSFNPNVAGVGVHQIVVERTGSNTCVNFDTAQVTVFAKPVINFIAANFRNYCELEPADTLRYIGKGGVSRLKYSCANPTFAISGDSVFRSDLLSNSSYPSVTVRAELEDTNGCLTDTSHIIRILKKPTVSLNLSPSRTCRNSGVIQVSGGSPSGGDFFGTGVDSVNGRYNPLLPSGNVDTITYVFTDPSNGCIDSASANFRIDTVPLIVFVFDDTLCENENGYRLKAMPEVTDPQNETGTFTSSTANINGNTLNPRLSGVGDHKVTYEFNNGRGCVDTGSTIVKIRALPSVNQPFLGSYCENSGSVVFNSGVPSGGQYYYRSFMLDGNKFNPDTSYVLRDTLVNVFYHYTDSFGCTNIDSNRVEVVAKPKVTFESTYFDNMCDNSPSIDLYTLGVSIVNPPPASGGFFSYDSSTSINQFDPVAYAKIDRLTRPALTYIYTDSLKGRCSDTIGLFPDIKASPIVSIEHSGAACSGLDHTLKGVGALTWIWSTGDSTPFINIQIDTVSSFTAIGQFGICYDTATTVVNITEGEKIRAIDDSTTLKKGTDVTLDPLERLYTSDTLALIGSFTVVQEPGEARNFTTSEGILSGINSTLFYEPNVDFRRTDSVLYEICNINCRNICDTARVAFKVLGDPYEFIPNAFTPNGDGVNDTWVVPGIEAFPENELFVYNRWGDLIYQAAPYKNDWAGQTNKGIMGGDKVVDGTYFYVLNTNDGEPLKGIIELKTK